MVIVATTDTMQKRINKCSLFNEKCKRICINAIVLLSIVTISVFFVLVFCL